MKPEAKRLKLALKIVVTAAALYFVFSRIDIGKLLEAYQNLLFPPLAAALAIFIFSKLLSAIRLNRFLRASGLSIGEKANIRLYLVGMFYNMFLPGGIGGDGYKIYLLKNKFNLPIGKIFAAVLADRISGILALFILSVFLFHFAGFASHWDLYAWILIPLAYILFYLAVRRFWSCFKGIVLRTSLLSLGVQAAQLGCAWLIMLALNISGHEASYLFVFLISSIVAIIPATVGGAGSREVAFLLGAGVLGLDVNVSIGLSFMFYFITLLVSLSGLVYVFQKPLDEKIEEPSDRTCKA